MSVTARQTAKALDLKDALLAAYDLEAVILFGSLGRGDGDEFSDVDLMVVMETDRDTKALGEEMMRHLDSLARDKHVIVRTPGEFCRQRDIPGTLVFSAVTEGRVLFEKPGWQKGHEPTESYETRRQEVIRQGYIQEARDFLAQAERFLDSGSPFRCRDFLRFASVRALKALFVKHDTQPPRETDLVSLLEKVRPLEPDVEGHEAFLRELSDYCPAGSCDQEVQRGGSLVQRTAGFVEKMSGRCAASSHGRTPS